MFMYLTTILISFNNILGYSTNRGFFDLIVTNSFPAR